MPFQPRRGKQPPSLVFQAGEAKIYLGGITSRNQAEQLQRAGVTLVVTCFKQSMQARGGVLPANSYTVKWLIAQPQRASQMRSVVRAVLANVRNNESVFVHCAAGKHRAATATAFFMEVITQQSFDWGARVVSRLRYTEIDYLLSQDDQLRPFLERSLQNLAARPKVAPRLQGVTLNWVACSRGSRSKNYWRASIQCLCGPAPVPADLLASDLAEALASGRRDCKTCLGCLPASLRCLSEGFR